MKSKTKRNVFSFILLFIFLTIFIYTITVFYLYYKYKISYIRQFNFCKQKLLYYEKEFLESPKVKECLEKGGCYEICGSGCGLPTKVNFWEFLTSLKFKSPSENIVCPHVCTKGCLLPP